MYRKRLIAAAVSIFIIGVIFGICMNGSDTFSFRAVFAVLSILSIIVIAVLARPNGTTVSKRMSAAAFAVAAFSLGVVRVTLFNEAASSISYYDGESDVAVFEISEVNDGSIDAYLLSGEIGVPTNEPVRLYLDNVNDGLVAGDIFTAEVTYAYRNTSSYYSNGISLSASGSITDYKNGNGVFYSIRKSVSENSKALYGSFENAEAISKAVTIGDRSDLDSYLFTLYKTAGISHILAISGLHISIIAFSLYNLLMMFSVGRNFASITSALFAVAYAALVGFTAGAVRSAVMIVILMFSRLFTRRADGITSISIALFILLLINPYSICSAGLQLSFLCSLGIMLVEPTIENIQVFFSSRLSRSGGIKLILYKMVPKIIAPAITSFAASVFSFPVLCMSFDTVSYASPFVNIIAVPLFTYAVELALIAFLVAPISNYIAMIFAYPAGFLFDFVTDIARFLFDIDLGVVSVHVKFMVIPLVLSILIIISLVFLIRNRIKVAAVLSVLFCVSIVACGLLNNIFNDGSAIVEYGNVNGEYVYCSVEDKGIYVDIGGYSSYPDVVFENGFTALDSYILLRYDTYSLERLDYFSGSVKVSKLYIPAPGNADDVLFIQSIKELANKRNCDIIYFDNSICEELSFGNSIEIFGNRDSISEETLICVNVNDKRIRFVGNAFNNAVDCDTAVIMKGYYGDKTKLYADTIYASMNYISDNESAERRFVGFDERLRFIINFSESGYDIYEP